MDKKEVFEYLKNNLEIYIGKDEDGDLYVSLDLEGELISKYWLD